MKSASSSYSSASASASASASSSDHGAPPLTEAQKAVLIREQNRKFEVTFNDYFNSPCLNRIFDDNRSRDYDPHPLERYSELVISTLNRVKSLSKYIAPVIGYFWYTNSGKKSEVLVETEDRHAVFFLFEWVSFRFFCVMIALYCVSYFTRAFLRSKSPVYINFVKTFKTASIRTSQLAKRDADVVRNIHSARNKLRREFDYDFKDWPVDFSWKKGKYVSRVPELLGLEDSGGYPLFDGTFVRLISKFMATTVGRCMLYPGSVGLLQSVLSNAIQTGRNFLIEKKKAQRFKLESRDTNLIDCIFVDRRNGQKDAQFNGNQLVICSEGNAGFYEIGIMSTPLEKEYSVMGWNHPGFGGSSGSPYPSNDINAIDVVINFATTKLGFPLENIILFGWSIGGFPTAWAAQQYPEIQGVILDASFDDVLPLARSKMMPLLLPIVDHTIRYHFNLNISAYLNQYHGPILIIRRLHDEIITLDPMKPLESNCGNHILIKLLEARFPFLLANEEMMGHLYTWLNTPMPESLIKNVSLDEALMPIRKYVEQHKVTTYPVNLTAFNVKKETIYVLASLMFKNYNSTHCTPLPSQYFNKPFNLFAKK